MADPLSLLRQYNVSKKEIINKDNVIFGEFSWPKTVKTNYQVYGSGKDGATKDYYTLECLLFLLKNVTLNHPAYVRMAASESIPVVNRPDRKELLAYLNGETSTAAAIDKSAPLEIPTQVKRTLEDASESMPKKARFDDLAASQRFKQHLAMRFDAPKPKMNSIVSNIDRSLSEAMSIEKIAAIKAKRLAMKRNTIKEDDDLPLDVDFGIDVTKDITSKERVWRQRTTILQSTGKQFGPSILALLKSIKMREEGRQRQQQQQQTGVGSLSAGLGGGVVVQQQQNKSYSRYAQEMFNPKEETAGFKIDTMSSYHGMSLKSVTEGGRKVTPQQQQHTPSLPPPPHKSPSLIPTPSSTPQSGAASPSQSPSQQQKRVSRTPIIIVPNSQTSLITMFNCKDLLQDMKYITNEVRRKQSSKRESEILIQRCKEGGLTVPYRVTDNPSKLNNSEWDRVVAVFAMGPAWQFKGWPYDGNPVEIFNRICAFHIKYDEVKLDQNIGKWSVHVITLNRIKRHLDRAAFQQCWEKLDRFMLFNKPHLRW
uniref:Parafibromin-like n=1 Tax=Hirondellea gigas TaxID=1518452 RepID=A0A2P2I2X2_9CRUS